jgi:glutaminyl-tRNA synthetase
MNMNFSLAFEKLGVPVESRRTIFRYDDTNPEAESQEYIDSIYNDLIWLGWKPERTTFSSDNFEILYQLAVQLIKGGLAYACNMRCVVEMSYNDQVNRLPSFIFSSLFHFTHFHIAFV